MALQVLERSRISPPSGSVSTTTLPLTFLDLPWLVVPPVQRLFFYEIQVSKTHFMDSILPNIKLSLSFSLQHFYPLAGNLTWPSDCTKPEILYMDGNSVSLTIAESNQDFHNLSANHPRDATQFHLLAPNFGPITHSHKPVPLLCLQVTLYPQKGICVGITANHVVADGRTSTLFMKSWASACKLQENSLSLPFYDRTVLEDKKEIEQILLNDLRKKFNITNKAFNKSVLPLPPTENVRATLIMTKQNVIRLKQWVIKKKQISNQLRLSTFVVTCAYVWVCLIRTRVRIEEEEDVTNAEGGMREYFSCPVDCRDQLCSPLPVTYFGNCYKICFVTGSRVDLIQDDGVATAAVLIAEAIHKTRNELWRSVETLFSMYETVDVAHVVSVAGSPKLAVYDVDFGWGKPKKVEVVSIGSRGAISISECSDGEGALEVGVVLNKKEMDVFYSLFVDGMVSFA